MTNDLISKEMITVRVSKYHEDEFKIGVYAHGNKEENTWDTIVWFDKKICKVELVKIETPNGKIAWNLIVEKDKFLKNRHIDKSRLKIIDSIT